ncbi:MAG: hypothetical protein Fur0042_11990 [Cyanophyceae cyanobacterium]
MVSRFASRLAIPILIVLVAVGSTLRLTHLDGKVFWIDEVHSALRIAGYGKAEVTQALTDRFSAPRAPELLRPTDLLAYWQPRRDRAPIGGVDVVTALATDNPQHPPAYYLLARAVLAVWPEPIAAARWTAAALSLLALPAIAWLAWELFRSGPVAIVATGLMAVSPVQILYAQEAREYSLLTVAIAVASALLLRALRLEGRRKWRSAVVPWGFYGLSVAAGLYVHPLFAYGVLAHGTFMVWVNGLRWTSAITQFSVAIAAAIAAYIPWIVVYLLHFDGMAWLSRSPEWGSLIQRWALVLTVPFIDLQPFYGDRLVDVQTGRDAIALGWGGWLLAVVPTVVLVALSFWGLWVRAIGVAQPFVTCLTLVPWLCLWLPDLIDGGQRATVARFLMPAYVGLYLLVAFAVAHWLADDRRYLSGTSLRIQRGFLVPWGGLLALVMAIAGLGTAIAGHGSATSWTKYSSYYEPEVAAIVQESERPLILAATDKATRLMGLSAELMRAPRADQKAAQSQANSQPNSQKSRGAGDRVRFLLLEKPYVPEQFPEGFDRVFLYQPYRELIEGLEAAGWPLEVRHGPGQLVEVLRRDA